MQKLRLATYCLPTAYQSMSALLLPLHLKPGIPERLAKAAISTDICCIFALATCWLRAKNDSFTTAGKSTWSSFGLTTGLTKAECDWLSDRLGLVPV